MHQLHTAEAPCATGHHRTCTFQSFMPRNPKPSSLCNHKVPCQHEHAEHQCKNQTASSSSAQRCSQRPNGLLYSKVEVETMGPYYGPLTLGSLYTYYVSYMYPFGFILLMVALSTAIHASYVFQCPPPSIKRYNLKASNDLISGVL